MMVCLIFHTAIIINRKNWRITIKLNFENVSICFKKSERTHARTIPPPSPLLVFVRFSMTPSPLSTTYFLKDPLQAFICVWPSLYIEALEINKFSKYSGNLIKSIMVIFRRVAWNYLKLYLQSFFNLIKNFEFQIKLVWFDIFQVFKC